MSASQRLLRLVKYRSLWTHVRRKVTTWSPVGAAFNAKPFRRLDLVEKNVVCTFFTSSPAVFTNVCRNQQKRTFFGDHNDIFPVVLCVRVTRVCLGCQSSAVLKVSRQPLRQPWKTLSSCCTEPAPALQEWRQWSISTNCQMGCAKWLIWWVYPP